MLCIFDCYVCCALLKCFAIRTFCRTMRHAFVNLECIRVQRLNTPTGLVAKVQCAFIGPLRRAFDAAIKAESFPIGVNNLQAP